MYTHNHPKKTLKLSFWIVLIRRGFHLIRLQDSLMSNILWIDCRIILISCIRITIGEKSQDSLFWCAYLVMALYQSDFRIMWLAISLELMDGLLRFVFFEDTEILKKCKNWDFLIGAVRPGCHLIRKEAFLVSSIFWINDEIFFCIEISIRES